MTIDRKALKAGAITLYEAIHAFPGGADLIDPEGGGDLTMCSVVMRKAIEAYEQAKGDSE